MTAARSAQCVRSAPELSCHGRGAAADTPPLSVTHSHFCCRGGFDLFSAGLKGARSGWESSAGAAAAAGASPTPPADNGSS